LHTLHKIAAVLNIFSKSTIPNNTNYDAMHFFLLFDGSKANQIACG